jgi:hypothetical protein
MYNESTGPVKRYQFVFADEIVEIHTQRWRWIYGFLLRQSNWEFETLLSEDFISATVHLKEFSLCPSQSRSKRAFQYQNISTFLEFKPERSSISRAYLDACFTIQQKKLQKIWKRLFPVKFTLYPLQISHMRRQVEVLNKIRTWTTKSRLGSEVKFFRLSVLFLPLNIILS